MSFLTNVTNAVLGGLYAGVGVSGGWGAVYLTRLAVRKLLPDDMEKADAWPKQEPEKKRATVLQEHNEETQRDRPLPLPLSDSGGFLDLWREWEFGGETNTQLRKRAKEMGLLHFSEEQQDDPGLFRVLQLSGNALVHFRKKLDHAAQALDFFDARGALIRAVPGANPTDIWKATSPEETKQSTITWEKPATSARETVYLHGGFYRLAKQLKDPITDSIDCTIKEINERIGHDIPVRITIAGHSQGAGVASCLALLLFDDKKKHQRYRRFPMQLYCFNPPAVWVQRTDGTAIDPFAETTVRYTRFSVNGDHVGRFQDYPKLRPFLKLARVCPSAFSTDIHGHLELSSELLRVSPLDSHTEYARFIREVVGKRGQPRFHFLTGVDNCVTKENDCRCASFIRECASFIREVVDKLTKENDGGSTDDANNSSSVSISVMVPVENPNENPNENRANILFAWKKARERLLFASRLVECSYILPELSRMHKRHTMFDKLGKAGDIFSSEEHQNCASVGYFLRGDLEKLQAGEKDRSDPVRLDVHITVRGTWSDMKTLQFYRDWWVNAAANPEKHEPYVPPKQPKPNGGDDASEQ